MILGRLLPFGGLGWWFIDFSGATIFQSATSSPQRDLHRPKLEHFSKLTLKTAKWCPNHHLYMLSISWDQTESDPKIRINGDKPKVHAEESKQTVPLRQLCTYCFCLLGLCWGRVGKARWIARSFDQLGWRVETGNCGSEELTPSKNCQQSEKWHVGPCSRWV